MDAFHIKRGDTSPHIGLYLEPATVVLTGATVRFQMRSRAGTMVVDAPAQVLTETGTPFVKYAWQAGDTDVADLFEAEFRVTYADGAVETFPNAGFIPVRIGEDVS